MASITPRAGAGGATCPSLLASYASCTNTGLRYHERSRAVAAEKGVALIAVRPYILAEEAEGIVEKVGRGAGGAAGGVALGAAGVDQVAGHAGAALKGVGSIGADQTLGGVAFIAIPK